MEAQVETGSVTFEEKSPSLAVVTIIGTPSDAAFHAHLEDTRRMALRGRRFGIVVDLSRSDRAPPSHRKMLASFLNEAEPTMQRACAGTVLVITNPLVRGALTAVFWIHKPSWPIEVVKTHAEAHAWLEQKLATNVS